MPARTVIVRNPRGLHARPAALFVQAARAHAAPVRLCKGDKMVNAKSVLAVLTLGLKCDDYVTIEMDGGGGEETLASLAAILSASIEEDSRSNPDAPSVRESR